MRCPSCQRDHDRVVDSRSVEDGAAVRRRRECCNCGQRFSTYERLEPQPLTVRKRDGSLQPFDRDKIVAGVIQAAKNRPLSAEAARRAAARVETQVRALGLREVPSPTVGAEVLTALRNLDLVAYLRFASVHKGFESSEDFRRELAALERPSS